MEEIAMDFFLLSDILLVFGLFLYLDELMTEHPNRFRAALYVLAVMVSFVSMTLTTLPDAIG
jgi:hypothetical protein